MKKMLFVVCMMLSSVASARDLLPIWMPTVQEAHEMLMSNDREDHLMVASYIQGVVQTLSVTGRFCTPAGRDKNQFTQDVITTFFEVLMKPSVAAKNPNTLLSQIQQTVTKNFPCR